MGIFQDGLIASDTDGVLCRKDGLIPAQTKRAIERVSKSEGSFLIAEDGDKKVGFIAGIVQYLDEIERLGSVNDRYGDVIELYVVEEYRGKNVAQMLMEDMESFFKNKKCPYVFIEVFGYNERAKKFYEKVDYHVRDYVMMKKL